MVLVYFVSTDGSTTWEAHAYESEIEMLDTSKMIESEYPDFNDAIDQFKQFLKSERLPSELQWAFKDNVYSRKHDLLTVSTPLPESNAQAAARAYSIGVSQDQLAIKAIGKLADSVITTIWYPQKEQDRPQGWEQGLRFAIVKPLPRVVEVSSGWSWKIRTLTPSFRRFRRNTDILSSGEIK